ncbi:hypothetical protein [Paludibacterium purpuratum]|uniref:Lipoprotein n=1 Tax=Paludibacterium purpuratum TaxID=1144873 RepID=A0A4R7B5R4_9NEIS|nr:hypothetical protein [Paludibacterium purpuratum]TDR79941.1 hypothetical protein DFP86_10680 [Paludibacterium purpuratum]
MKKRFLSAVLVLLAGLLTGCAHPIMISPSNAMHPQSANPIGKNVAYVMSDADRSKEVITPGGGGDKISYYPYRDLEKAIRDALHVAYKDVTVVDKQGNLEVLKAHQVSYVFVPEITTTSESPSLFTWPPTKFRIEMAVNVFDGAGQLVTQIRTVGSGSAEFSEFKSNFGLAGNRAADDLEAKLVEEIKRNPKLQ